MIVRKAENTIKKWIQTSSNALLVSGARQVGKTYTIRKCLHEEGVDYIEINLIEQPELIPLIEQAYSVDDFVINVSALTNYTFKPGESFIFIDEVQELKDIITRIKFWVDDKRFRFIISGSLLGVELNNLRSVPVGYLDEIKMYPVDFEEFLRASEVNDDTIVYLKNCFKERKQVGDGINSKMMEHFRRYLVVGGMPAAVNEYITTRNISTVYGIQQNIIEQYKKDFTKYEADSKKLKLLSIYDLIPSELLKQNRRFNFADLKKGLKFDRVESSFVWLEAAGVVISTYNATEPRVPLLQNKKSSFVKLYSSDVGLLTCQYGRTMKANILVENVKLNLGGLYENVVAQELHAHGLESYYYNTHSIGELDFIIEEDFHPVPIEVKSGKDYTIHSALNKVVNNQEYGVEHAYVFANCDVKVDGKILYLPVYMCAFIDNDIDLPVLDKI